MDAGRLPWRAGIGQRVAAIQHEGVVRSMANARMIAMPVSILFRSHGKKGAIEKQLDIAGERRPNAERGHSDGALVRSAAGNRLKRAPMSILPSISSPVN